MITMENQYGKVQISHTYFANLVGKAASECFGVAGMRTLPSQGLRGMMSKGDLPDKGVAVHMSGAKLIVDLHIAVVYGMNISAISKSIMHKVRYTVEQATGLQVGKVNVFVDAMKND